VEAGALVAVLGSPASGLLLVGIDGDLVGGVLGLGGYVLCGAALIIYLLFSAPTYCGAINRRPGPANATEYCRNNSTGLLLGCNLRQHKWQKFHSSFWTGQVRERTRGMFDSPSAKLQTLAAVVGLVSALIGFIRGLLILS
jgi:hypothetical protein